MLTNRWQLAEHDFELTNPLSPLTLTTGDSTR